MQLLLQAYILRVIKSRILLWRGVGQYIWKIGLEYTLKKTNCNLRSRCLTLVAWGSWGIGRTTLKPSTAASKFESVKRSYFYCTKKKSTSIFFYPKKSRLISWPESRDSFPRTAHARPVCISKASKRTTDVGPVGKFDWNRGLIFICLLDEGTIANLAYELMKFNSRLLL